MVVPDSALAYLRSAHHRGAVTSWRLRPGRWRREDLSRTRRCFRDEDLRGDRQPEFTQLDLEMSFVDEDAVMAFVEEMVIEVCRVTTPDRPFQETPFPRFTCDEAMDRFGSDKPDLRFRMELVDLGPRLVDPAGSPSSGFRVFDETLADGGLSCPGAGRLDGHGRSP